MRDEWIEIKLGDILSVSSGKGLTSKKMTGFGYPVYGGNGVTGYHSEYLLEHEKLIIGRVGVRCGVTHLTKPRAWVTDNALIVDFKVAAFDLRFMQLKLLFENLNKLSNSTAQPVISGAKIYSYVVTVAPLPEQRAIVAKTEELFSSLDSGISDLKKAQEQLKVYRQAVLKKAFEGEYMQVKVIEISDVKTGSTPKRGNTDYWNNGNIAWITSGALNSLFVNEAKEFITETALKETNCKIIPKGSLLVAMYGEGKTRGKCSELNIDAATNQAIATITLFEEHKNYKTFLKWFFLKNYEEIRLLSSGGVQPNLNLSMIKNTVIPFPSPKEQQQIVQEIESRLSVCDKVEESIVESLEKAKALRQSILKKAFEGKLLNEQELDTCKKEPDWEPAGVLLERIKKEREDKGEIEKSAKEKRKKKVNGKRKL